jgi:hypothetical protein
MIMDSHGRGSPDGAHRTDVTGVKRPLDHLRRSRIGLARSWGAVLVLAMEAAEMTDRSADGLPAADAEIVGTADYVAGMADADTRIDSLKDDIRVLSYSVLDLQEKANAHDAKFDEILITLDAHGAKLDDHDRRFDNVDAQLAEILARLPQRAD